jgi:transposase
VRYTGDNNVTYERTCEPTPSDIAVERLEPRYLPVISQTVALGEYSYEFAHVAAGDDIAILDDGIRRCAHCETAGDAGSYSFCPNCGAIACGTHSKTEALAGEPICTGCAVTTWALLRRRYFYDQADRERFQAELAAIASRGPLSISWRGQRGGMTAQTTAERYDLVIDGARRPASEGGRFETVDPATGTAFAEVARGTAADIDLAVAAARRALPDWRGMAPQERGRLLGALADRLRQEQDRLAALETRDNGKPISHARRDVETCARYFEYYAGIADKVHGESRSSPGTYRRTSSAGVSPLRWRRATWPS